MLQPSPSREIVPLPQSGQKIRENPPRRPGLKQPLVSILFSCFLLTFSFLPGVLQAANPFPQYPVIEKNVRFWEDIYGRYSNSQAVVHDSNDLGIVYEVLPIFNSQLPGASKVNRPLFKGMKNKYVQILKRLGQGVPPRSRD
ncbi:MAG: hypothetical protein ABFR63_07720, partial [Thermodesulfobacteriota bacterium]